MRKDELEEIFNEYLQRKPREQEYKWHQNKSYSEFTNEILNCEEYKRIVSRLKLPRIKIAILVSGHVRYNSIKDSLKLLNGYDYDVFIHTWDNMGFKGSETNLNDTVNYEFVEKSIIDTPNLKNYKIENNKEFINSLKENDVTYFNYSSPEKFIKSQLYSINQSYKIFEQYCDENKLTYDVVIKVRFDTPFIFFDLDVDTVSNLKNSNLIYTPNVDCRHTHPDSNSTTCQVCETMFYTHGLKKVHVFNHSNVICDIFAYGSPNSMKHYCSLYENYDLINKSFEESNKKIVAEHNIVHTKENNVYRLTMDVAGHLNSLYYVNCSYPERLLSVHLRDYILPTSRRIKVDFKR